MEFISNKLENPVLVFVVQEKLLSQTYLLEGDCLLTLVFCGHGSHQFSWFLFVISDFLPGKYPKQHQVLLCCSLPARASSLQRNPEILFVLHLWNLHVLQEDMTDFSRQSWGVVDVFMSEEISRVYLWNMQIPDAKQSF